MGGDEMGEGGQKVQTSGYKKKVMGCNICRRKEGGPLRWDILQKRSKHETCLRTQ